MKADKHSIMCYQLPGSIMKDGKANAGGLDIDKKDFVFAASMYPKKVKVKVQMVHDRSCRRRISICVVFLATLSSCINRNSSAEYSLLACRDSLRVRSQLQGAFLRQARVSRRTFAVIGDGIASAALLTNLDKHAIRVYGDSSFWTRVVGIDAVWQMSLKGPFRRARLPLPKETPGQRIKREEILRSNWEALVRSRADYVACGRVRVVPDGDSAWTLTDQTGQVLERIAGPLILATGTLRPLTIADLGIADSTTRDSLSKANRIQSGDDFLSGNSSLKGTVVGILGTGGSAADCLPAAFRRGAGDVIVWGEVGTELTLAPAFDSLMAAYGGKACHVNTRVSRVTFDGTAIEVNGTSCPSCDNHSRLSQRVCNVDRLVESLGRDITSSPLEVMQAAAGRNVIYHPVTDHTGALVAIRVTFSPQSPTQPRRSPPLYLVGAVAMWLPKDVAITSVDRQVYLAGCEKILDRVNGGVTSKGREHGRYGFAVGAAMGAGLARLLKGHL